MKKLKIVLLTVILASTASSIALADQVQVEVKQKINIEVIIGQRPPAPNERILMRLEEQKHPKIVMAIHDVENSLKLLDAAPDDFGGHKASARQSLVDSLISLKKALYYRLYEDTH